MVDLKIEIHGKLIILLALQHWIGFDADALVYLIDCGDISRECVEPYDVHGPRSPLTTPHATSDLTIIKDNFLPVFRSY